MVLKIQRYIELKAANAISLAKNVTQVSGQEEQTYIITTKNFDPDTGQELISQTAQITDESLARSLAGLEAQIKGIKALRTDIKEL